MQSDIIDYSDKMPNLVNDLANPEPKRAKITKAGELCHHCRSRGGPHVTCSRPKCKHKFCSACLRNRHGEKIDSERAANVRWVCPRCRGGCGEACVRSCCNCSTCRAARQLKPTGKLTVRIARAAGFTNVHDYLVHLETQETAAAIADRKKGRGWTSIDAVAEDGATPAIAHRENGHELTSIDPVSENLVSEDRVNSISENHVSENHGLENHVLENKPTFIDYEALVSKETVRIFIECEPSSYDLLMQGVEKKEPGKDEDFFV